MAPAFSIVMPTLNAQAHIGAAIDSLISQNLGDEIELIVADGGSQDNTRKIARSFDHVRVLDGGDSGIYDGFNRGIMASTGDIIGFLNADDFLAADALRLVYDAFRNKTSCDYVSGGVTIQAVDIGEAPDENSEVLHNTVPLTPTGVLFGIPAINGRFFRRAAVAKINGFMPKAGLAADREFLLRVIDAELDGHNLEQTVYHYRIHKDSSTIAGDRQSRQRVLDAELTLAGYLKSKGGQGCSNSSLIEQTRTLAALKQRVLYWRRRHDTGPTAEQAGYPPSLRWQHIPGAILNWRSWRGKLSGY